MNGIVVRRALLPTATSAIIALCCAGCDSGSSAEDSAADAAPSDSAPETAVAADGEPDADLDSAVDAVDLDLGSDAPDAGRTTFVVVTFNTGTSEQMGHDLPPDDGYTSQHALTSDLYYGDGLAWTKAVDAAKAFFASIDADIVAFQEVFWTGECPSIPTSAYPDFICESWKAGDPTVAQMILGPGWQVGCHLGFPDKCAAVRKSFGTFRGCDSDFCLEGALDGAKIEGCGGKGGRIGRGVIDLVGGGTITLVSVHASSGIDGDSIDCRFEQVKQVFEDLDGEPAANGARNIIMGDFNTDPGRAALLDKSAAKWNEYVGPGKAFHFVSDVGPNAPPSYAGLFNIDHVVSDGFDGPCWTAGVTAGHPKVMDAVYFDHTPLVCTLEL